MSGDETEKALLFYQLLPSRSPFFRRGMGGGGLGKECLQENQDKRAQ